MESIKYLSENKTITLRKKIKMVIILSIPAILAQLSAIAMQYIDASMVGSLGAKASASIGLMASSTWLIGGLCMSVSTGFSVQVAHLIGAGKDKDARNVLRQSIICTFVFSLILSIIGMLISPYLPIWLRGDKDIIKDASGYFFVYSCAIVATAFRNLASSMLQCSGDMKTPSALNIAMCFLDVLFNGMFIFSSRKVSILGVSFTLWGANLGVKGAALGTALAEIVVTILLLIALCIRSEQLSIYNNKGSWRLRRNCLTKAIWIAVPIGIERFIMNGAQIVSTSIIAPLGTISIAANSLAVTAESLCYMPGFGVQAAATTLVGQSIGAGKFDLAKSFSRITVLFGVIIMSATGALMYIFAPLMFDLLTPDKNVQTLGVDILRIVAFAEPFFAMSIVGAGALRGAEDTVVPSIMNLISMWGVRIVLTIILVPEFGLYGAWIAMAVELTVRGILFLIRVFREKWLNKYIQRNVLNKQIY
jgi:putative MATE family efflux protein